ncbi:hypothetical protein C5167_039192 [Papaver somniferum]|uniref:Uncharacterized protein n=1 Tax=Papaver somniferum TaxID=3469 RepID=A0A4Y7IFP9_PAPSO|nr:hypothetical protein C5167_039192 [Papaver somniferum]
MELVEIDGWVSSKLSINGG